MLVRRIGRKANSSQEFDDGADGMTITAGMGRDEFRLHDDVGAATDHVDRATQDRQFVSLNVDLHVVDTVNVLLSQEIVEPPHRNRRPILVADRDVGRAGIPTIRRYSQFSVGIADGAVQRRHIGETVSRHIVGEIAMRAGIGFDGEDASGRADEPAGEYGIDADICTHIDEDLPRRETPGDESLKFRVALAGKIDRQGGKIISHRSEMDALGRVEVGISVQQLQRRPAHELQCARHRRTLEGSRARQPLQPPFQRTKRRGRDGFEVEQDITPLFMRAAFCGRERAGPQRLQVTSASLRSGSIGGIKNGR